MNVFAGHILIRVAGAVGCLTVLWALFSAGIEKRRQESLSKEFHEPREPYLQFVWRYLSKRQRIAFLVLLAFTFLCGASGLYFTR
jgi:hypothetical protein